jgi:hypothetical protein
MDQVEVFGPATLASTCAVVVLLESGLVDHPANGSHPGGHSSSDWVRSPRLPGAVSRQYGSGGLQRSLRIHWMPFD